MVDWVDVVRRLLALYHVKTQEELSMAMGVSVRMGEGGSIDSTGIPWKILAKAVNDTKVSWDWLLEGTGDPPADAGQVPPRPATESRPATASGQGGESAPEFPNLETRQLARQLLSSDGGAIPSPDRLVRELEDIKHTMQDEIDRVNRVLRDR